MKSAINITSLINVKHFNCYRLSRIWKWFALTPYYRQHSDNNSSVTQYVCHSTYNSALENTAERSPTSTISPRTCTHSDGCEGFDPKSTNVELQGVCPLPNTDSGKVAPWQTAEEQNATKQVADELESKVPEIYNLILEGERTGKPSSGPPIISRRWPEQFQKQCVSLQNGKEWGYIQYCKRVLHLP